MKPTLYLAALCAGLCGAVTAAELTAGPMAGPPRLRGVTLWLQADGPARASVEYWSEKSPKAKRRSTEIALQAGEDFAGKLNLFGLEPGEGYGYRILLDGKPQAGNKQYRFATQPLWQWRSDAPDFKLLAGSCNYGNEPAYDRPGKPYGDKHLAIFSKMAEQKPDLTLWLGDNVYFREVDYDSADGMAYRWKRERSQGYMQPLLQVGGHAAIWDDHDYGPNDSNRSFVFKGEALKLQQRYWANPSYGLPETPGTFTTFSYSDVDFFLLDNRSYRDDPALPLSPQKAMFGPEQMRWLKNALLNSSAPFKIIAGGSLMLFDDPRADDWSDFPAERDDFLRWLQESKVEGVIFMSGDVHRSQLVKLERAGNYPLYELTCSPLSSGPGKADAVNDHPAIVPGTLVAGERNFCSLQFQGKKAERQLSITVFNAEGEQKWQQVLLRSALGKGK